MATLENTGAIFPDIADAIRADVAGFQGRKREKEKIAGQADRIERFTGGGSAKSSPLGRLGTLSPEMAQTVTQAQQGGDLDVINAVRQEAQKGTKLATEIQKLPDFAAKQRRLREEAGRVVAGGGDISRILELSNLDEPKLDLELQKMNLIGKDTLTALPAPRQPDPLRFLSDPDRNRAFAEFSANDPAAGASFLSARSAQLGRDVQVSEGELAREATASEGALSRANVERFEPVFNSKGEIVGQQSSKSGRVFEDPRTGEQDDVPARMGFSKEQTGRFNAAVARGATQQQAISEAVSTGSERTKNVTVDQSIKSLNRGLNRFEKFVAKTGAIVNPFSAEAQTGQTMRRGIQLQLKELFDLGVLNGPDLALMDQILFDPQLSLNPIGDAGVNIPINTEKRVKASVTEIKKIIADIAAGRRLPSRFGQEDVSQQPALQPNNPILTPGQAASDIRGVPQPPPGFTVVQ